MLREKTGLLARTTRLAVLPCSLVLLSAGVQHVEAGNYQDVIASQTPLLFFDMNNPEPVPDAGIDILPATIDNIDALLGPDLYNNDANAGADILMGVASMTPSGGFLGFESTNTAFNFNTSGAGSVITTLFLEDPLNTDDTHNPMGMTGSSVSMWFNTTDPNLADPFISGVLWRGDEGSGHNLNLRVIDDGLGNGTLALNLEEGEFIILGAATDGSTDYSDGAWHHVMATWDYDMNTDQGNLRVYVDGGTLGGGEQVTTSFTSADYAPILVESDPVNNPGVFDDVMDFDFRNRIGKGRNNAMRFNGDIDEAAVWNRVLTDQEIADQYAAAFVEGGLEGDLNGDGFVGLDDLDIILNNWNLNVPPGDPAADPSGDGFVGLDDLDVVLNNWNNGTPPAGSAVPEPTTLALLGLGGIAALRRR